MKTITYNPETHVLVPREPSQGMIDAMPPVEEIGYWAMYEAAIAAAPQPEPVDVGSVGWKHDCAALCANDIELWIDRCPHCGKPRHNHPPTDDELLNKAEPVDSEPAMWVMKHIRSGDLAQAKPNQKALHPYMWSDAFPRYTTPQPDRTAELAALKAVNESLRKDASRLDWVEHQDFHDLSFAILVDQPNDGMTAVSISEGWHLGNNLREALDAAMAQGEQE